MNKELYFLELNNGNKSDDRLKALEEYAKLYKVPIIQKEGLDFLIHTIKVSQVKKILEIGTAIGYSAINFALIDQDIVVATIERDEVMYNEAIKNINLFALENRIKVIFGDALEVEDQNFETIDLLFIDAAKSQYQKFFEKYTKFLKKGGLVITDNLIFHNLLFEDVIENRNTRQLVSKIKKYNEWLANNSLYDTYFCPLGDGIAISIKK
ncbi:MAG: pcm [Haloplasmataceae bacterium]|jgi:predicted O-methyltransferase YrrM|nr:pcm [Haloplasmataceae bacterium]